MKNLIILGAIIAQPFLATQPLIEVSQEPSKIEIREFQEVGKLPELELPVGRTERPQKPVSVQSGGITNCEELRSRMAQLGISGAELTAAVELGRLESGCKSSARNPSSGACNVFQELKCGKWGGLLDTDAHLRGAISYCRNRYGTFQNALATWHKRSPSWW